MNYPVSERVGAFILRKKQQHKYELLLFKHSTGDESSIQIPGGGVERGESLEAALHREICEESGLINLPILRKLGTCERCWLDTGNLSRRHYFLLEADPATPDSWNHIVHGNGKDAGFCFSYFWQRPTADLMLTGGSRMFLNPYYLPELYE